VPEGPRGFPPRGFFGANERGPGGLTVPRAGRLRARLRRTTLRLSPIPQTLGAPRVGLIGQLRVHHRRADIGVAELALHVHDGLAPVAQQQPQV